MKFGEAARKPASGTPRSKFLDSCHTDPQAPNWRNLIGSSSVPTPVHTARLAGNREIFRACSILNFFPSLRHRQTTTSATLPSIPDLAIPSAGDQLLAPLPPRERQSPPRYPTRTQMSPSIAAARPLLRRPALQMGRRLAARRLESTTAKEGAKEAASKATEYTAKAAQGLSRVTSAAGPAIMGAAKGVTGALGRVGGRTGRLIAFAERTFGPIASPPRSVLALMVLLFLERGWLRYRVAAQWQMANCFC